MLCVYVVAYYESCVSVSILHFTNVSCVGIYILWMKEYSMIHASWSHDEGSVFRKPLEALPESKAFAF